jgi:hypothetical protein
MRGVRALAPNRWLHVRHHGGFSSDQFDIFRAHCRAFRAFVEAALSEWALLGRGPAPKYEFFEPELSTDRTIASLPLGGEQTLGSRYAFEDWRSFMLWEWFPVAFIQQLDEGITEMVGEATLAPTNWRRPTLRLPAWVPKSGGS